MYTRIENPLELSSEEEVPMKFPVAKKVKKKPKRSVGDAMSDPVKILCQFCGEPSTLCIGDRFYLCASKTVPGLKICNECKSYEYRYNRLVSRKRKLSHDQKAKRQFYSMNPAEIEVEACYKDGNGIGFRSTGGSSTVKKTSQVLPKIPKKVESQVASTDLPLQDDPFVDLNDKCLDIEESDCDNDLQCNHCNDFISDMSHLVMCADCDKIYHISCLVSRNHNYALLNEPSRPVVIHCRDHCSTPFPPVKSPKLKFGRSDLTRFDFPSHGFETPAFPTGLPFEQFLRSFVEGHKRMEQEKMNAVGASFVLRGY